MGRGYSSYDAAYYGGSEQHPDCPGGCGELADECACPPARRNPLGSMKINSVPPHDAAPGRHDKHVFTVTVSDCTYKQAIQVITERIGYDENYDFDYKINWSE